MSSEKRRSNWMHEKKGGKNEPPKTKKPQVAPKPQGITSSPETCEWVYDEARNQWKTECGHVRVFSAIAMQPDYPGYDYCCHCGRKLVVIKTNKPGVLVD